MGIINSLLDFVDNLHREVVAGGLLVLLSSPLCALYTFYVYVRHF